MRMSILLAVLAVFVSRPARAQAPQFADAFRASAELELAARRAAPVRYALPSFSSALAPAGRRQRHALGTTLMLIGGGAVVVGALAGGGGGAVLIVGGVGCAAYGFYLYQQ